MLAFNNSIGMKIGGGPEVFEGSEQTGNSYHWLKGSMELERGEQKC